MPLFKTAPELMGQGYNLMLQGNFSAAGERFSEAADKFSKRGDAPSAALASAYGSVMLLSAHRQDPQALRLVQQSLQSLGPTMMKLGLREVPAFQLAIEAGLLAEERELAAVVPTNPEQHAAKAKQLQDLSIRFRTQVGDNVLILPELLREGTIRGTQKAVPLAAEAEQEMGESLVATDPKAAAEHYQSARLWWSQAGAMGEAQQAAERVGMYGRSARCWFCGREVTGEGIHFVQMPSELTDTLRKSSADTVLSSFTPAGDAVYACRGCYSAVYKLSDKIALQRTEELEARVRAQIESLKSEISSIKSRLNMIG